MTTKTKNIIEVKNLIKTYTTYKRESGFGAVIKSFFKREKIEINAVDNISFTIADGEICGILGPNGAGKSTTIKMLCGALFPTSGNIKAMGFNPSKERKHYVREIGAVFGQKSQLIWDIPPLDSFVMNKRMKCEFVMAMLHNPKIVFLDEPTIGLDVIAKTRIREFIRQMNEKGVTFILTTHDLDDVKQLADRVVVINHGRKVFDDTLQKLQSSLGEKKIVELVLIKPFDNIIPDNVTLIGQKSELEITLEIDMSKIPMDSFIKILSEAINFSDISIKELPMEQIITQIYSAE